jgi:hypothetical protein
MTQSTRPPVFPRIASTPPDEVDGLLRRFFRAQMPSPWPKAPETSEYKTMTPSRSLAVLRFFRPSIRLAVAAAVAALVIGYLALQSWFPDPKAVNPSAADNDHQLGSKLPKIKLQEQKSPTNPGAQLIIVEELPPSKK